MHLSRNALSAVAAILLNMWIAPQTSAQAPPQARLTIALDAAHGGNDTGAHLASGQLEKDLTLALSVRLRSLLAARGFAVVTTREADTSVEPDKRTEIANHARASLCLLLHATETGTGIHLFTSGISPAPAAPFPPWKTAQSAFISKSLALAGSLNSALTQSGLTVTLGSASLPAIDSFTCPVVAIEIAPDRATGGAVTAEPDDASYDQRIDTAIIAAVLQFTAEAHQP